MKTKLLQLFYFINNYCMKKKENISLFFKIFLIFLWILVIILAFVGLFYSQKEEEKIKPKIHINYMSGKIETLNLQLYNNEKTITIEYVKTKGGEYFIVKEIIK